ncbi:MAG: DUF2917 domain-containing protein [Burkholderiaceae bacterium]|nr:DUF2917 domain-containing protein [Burkholderiaceae bacterium]
MFITTHKVNVPVQLGSVARLQRARHTRLSVRRGEAWITLDGDLRDIVLAAGESFVLDSDAAVVVYPLRGGGSLELELTGGSGWAQVVGVGSHAGLLARLADALRQWLRPALPAGAR